MKTDINEGRWVTLDSEYLFRRPWLTVRRDRIRNPLTGKENPEYYVLEYPDWVNTIAIDREGRFIMVRQYRHGLDETRYELCAGVVEEGEEPLVAAKRELSEETGYTGGTWTKLCTLSGNSSTTSNLTHCFLAVGVERTTEQHLDATEEITVEVLTSEEVYRLLADDQIRQALMAAPLWRYFALAR